MKTFAIIGVAGYIADRHLKAIKSTSNILIGALDKFDCVGKIDNYFPEADFFIEFERFDRHFDKLKRIGKKVDFVSICTPNYLHDSHIRFALRHHADAICEKPLVLNPWNVDALKEIQNETGNKIFNILQVRLHPNIIKLKQEIDIQSNDVIHEIDLTYITSRGNWYLISWKADINKSGGVATNIGIHFFDMLIWIFGNVKENVVHYSDNQTTSGFLRLEKARVRWFLSIDYNHIPDELKKSGKRTYRSITVDGKEIEFSEGFTELHTESYRHILEGKGFGLEEARASIETAFTIRNSKPIGLRGEYHPLAKSCL